MRSTGAWAGHKRRLHRKLGAARHDRLQLLQHALGIGNIGDDEPRHAREQYDGVDSGLASRLRKIEDDRHVVA